MEPDQSAEEWDTVSSAIALGERQSHINISDFSTDARAIWNANKDATSIPIMIGMQPWNNILDLPCNSTMLKMVKKEEDTVNDCVMVSISYTCSFDLYYTHKTVPSPLGCQGDRSNSSRGHSCKSLYREE